MESKIVFIYIWNKKDPLKLVEKFFDSKHASMSQIKDYQIFNLAAYFAYEHLDGDNMSRFFSIVFTLFLLHSLFPLRFPLSEFFIPSMLILWMGSDGRSFCVLAGDIRINVRGLSTLFVG